MNSKKKIITSILVTVLVVGTLTATYAYFQARIGTGSTTNTTVTAKTIDGLTFNQGTNLSITATQTNFASGKGNLSSSTSPTVILKARNDASASYNYKACLNITENTFIHSQISSTETSNGRTVNLIDGNLWNEEKTESGITIKYNKEEDYFLLNGTTTRGGSYYPKSINLLTNANSYYSLSIRYVSGDVTIPSGYAIFYLGNGDETTDNNNWYSSSNFSINNDIDISVRQNPKKYLTKGWFYISEGVSFDNYKIRIQIEENSTATPYDQYGYIENSDLELTVTKNGTTVLTKDITHGTGEICIPTTNGGSTTTHTISAAAGATTTDTWNAMVTFKNYNNNQNINLDKTFNSNFVFTRI